MIASGGEATATIERTKKPVNVTYRRSELSSPADNVKNEVGPGFINDNYWALFARGGDHAD